MLDPDWPSVVSNNRDYIKMLLQYHQYFCCEEMAYPGHDKTNESLNAGIWKEFINLMLRTNPLFKNYHDKMKQRYRTYNYSSKRSFNELVKAMAFEVRRKIKEHIDEAGIHSMLIINEFGEMEQRFYELARLKETDAATIVNTDLTAFARMNASASLLAVVADGASVTSGCYEGVAARLARQYPWLIYIHCAAHRLNLIVATYLCKVKTAKDVIETYKALRKIFNVAKHKELFEECQKERYPKEPLMAASSLTEV